MAKRNIRPTNVPPEVLREHNEQQDLVKWLKDQITSQNPDPEALDYMKIFDSENIKHLANLLKV